MIVNANGYSDKSATVDLLWENNAPKTVFAAQTLNIDLSGYEMLYVVFITATDYTYLNVSMLVNDPSINKQMIASRAGMVQSRRDISLTNNTIAFGNGIFSKNSANGTVSNGNGTKYAIPYRIYGRK